MDQALDAEHDVERAPQGRIVRRDRERDRAIDSHSPRIALRDPPLSLIDGDAEPTSAELAAEIETRSTVAAPRIKGIDLIGAGNGLGDQVMNDTITVLARAGIEQRAVNGVGAGRGECAKPARDLRPEIDEIVVAVDVSMLANLCQG